MIGDRAIKFSNDVSCVLCGAAGQGIQTIENIFPSLLKLCGYNVFATKEYMSRVRGGSNSTEIRVASERVSAYLNRIDILVPLDKDALPHLERRISPQTVILGDKEKLVSDYEIIDIPFSKTAQEIGGSIYENVIAVGVLAGIFHLDLKSVSGFIRKYFSKKSEEIIQNNIMAVEKGFERGSDFCRSGKFCIDIQKNEQVADELLWNGAEMLGLGAIGGGCNFIAAYPMTPSTGVFAFLAQHADDFDIIAEQAEDEISAINMSLGAWYAGARALVTTSGGGFALMAEGVSLAGMIESPVVISLGQRPGPATGLPTRTEQADLELALYAGHGEFPRVIYAPGTLKDAFFLMQRAFNSADKYQIPVFVLSDQLLVDSLYNIPAPDITAIEGQKHIVKTKKDYKRYRLTVSGISPRGIPGYGSGLVGVDSDEHDEEGHITENQDVRRAMVEKRLKKLDMIKQEMIPPELIGEKEYKTLVIGWGSTYSVIKEAIEKIRSDSLAFLYVKQVYPLHNDIAVFMEKAEHTMIVENNATSQFAKLIKLHLGMDVDTKILKYDGLPFSVEELIEKINEKL